MFFRISMAIFVFCTFSIAEVLAEKDSVFSVRQKIAKSARVTTDEDLLALHKTPIYRYHEVVRGFRDGSTWMWKTPDGLPAMILNLSGKDEPFYEFMSLTNSQLSCSVSGFVWAPKDVTPSKPIPDAPPPAYHGVARKIQMEDMAKKFTSVLIDRHSGQKIELRLLPEPLFRYGQEKGSRLDGAMFAFVRDGDPEIVLTIEAKANPETGLYRWVFNCNRLAISEQHVSFDGEEVWSCDKRSYGDSTDPYCVRSLQSPLRVDEPH